MPSPLNNILVENYFALLGAHLSQMPDAARDEHLRELRQHLESLVAARQAQGVSDDDAVTAALAQMGDPAQIGRKLWHEWKLTTQRQFWRTVLIIGLGQFVVTNVFMAIEWLDISSFLRHHPSYHLTNGIDWNELNMGVGLLLPIICGVIVGKKMPERAIIAAFGVGLISSLADIPWWAEGQIHYHLMALPNIDVSGYEILAAYIVSSLRRKNWTVQVS